MKILFIGGTKRGYRTLQALLTQGKTLVGVISLSQDEHEVERYEGKIEDLALTHGLPHFRTRSMAERDYTKLISDEIRPDVTIVVGCRVIIPKAIYKIPILGTLAVHDSLLPHYRGFAPINWAIINGEQRTGVTLFHLDERMDGGDVVGQKTVEIKRRDTAPQLYEKICDATVSLVIDMCSRLQSGTAVRVSQDYQSGTFTCSRTPADGMIDWTRSTVEVYNKVRALTYPYPGAYTFYKNEKLFIWGADPIADRKEYVGRIPGRVVGISKSEGYVDVLTGDGILRVRDVQVEGSENLSAASVIGSIKTSLGLDVVSLLQRVRELEQKLGSLISNTRM